MQSNGNGTEVWEKGIQVDLPDGEYEIEVQLTGGSGRASVTSPAILQVQDEKAVIEIEWSSPNYDYMTMDGETYLPVNTEGNSVFELPVTAFDKEVPVTADTTAGFRQSTRKHQIMLMWLKLQYMRWSDRPGSRNSS